MEACYTCAVAEAYLANTSGFIERLLGAVQGPMQVLFIAMAGVWLALLGLRLTLNTANFIEFGKDAVFLLIGYGFLEGLNTQFVTAIFEATINTMYGAAARMIGESTGSTAVNTAGLLLSSIERAFWTPILISWNMIQNAGVLEAVVITFFALVLCLPFVLMLILYVKHVVWGLFRVTLIAIMSPFIVGVSSFPFGRQVWSTAINQMLASILVLTAVTAVFSLIFSAIQIPLESMSQISPDEFTNQQIGEFLMAVILAWCGTYLVTESASFAAAMASTTLSTINGLEFTRGQKPQDSNNKTEQTTTGEPKSPPGNDPLDRAPTDPNDFTMGSAKLHGGKT